MKRLPALLRYLAPSALLLLLLAGCNNADVTPRSLESGRAGSLSRFTILGNTLYSIDNQTLRIFDISNANSPMSVSSLALGQGIETIYPEDNYLFVGTASGMYVLDATTPQAPRRVGYYNKAVSCDPVAVQGNYAYFTLRTGRTCGGGNNQLQVVDLTDLSQPRLAQTYSLTYPFGLDADSALLFVCDDGLKIFDARQSPTLVQLDQFPIEAFEVTLDQNRQVVLGSHGIYQYQYANRALPLLSVLPVTPRP